MILMLFQDLVMVMRSSIALQTPRQRRGFLSRPCGEGRPKAAVLL